MTYRILVETINGNILTFKNVLKYELKEGMLLFKDELTNLEKMFPSIKCQVEEERGDSK